MFSDTPVSGIHRLFTSGSAQPSQPNRQQLESVTEESHTFDLLFPDFHTLRQSQEQIYPLQLGVSSANASTASSFDDRGGLDLRYPRDIRIIIAQDGNLSHQAKVLYDSQPPVFSPPERTAGQGPRDGRSGQSTAPSKTQTFPAAPSGTKHRRHPSLDQHANTSPLVQRPLFTPETRPSDAPTSPRPRRILSRPISSEGNPRNNKLAKEGKAEVNALLSCMFGSTGLPLVSGTKLHVRPLATVKAGERETVTGLPDFGHSRRTNNLPWSAAANEAPTFSTSAPSGQPDTRRPRSKDSSILITRLFTVDASDIMIPSSFQDPARYSEETEVQHFDSTPSEQPSQITEGAAIKQIKCPTYALSIVLQAASTTQQGWPSASQVASQASAQTSSSFESPAREQSSQADAASHFPHGSDCGIEQVTSYWTALTRLLCSLEAGFQQRIGDALGSVVKDLRLRPLPDFQPTTTVLRDTAAPPVKRKLQPSQRLIQLPVNALQHSKAVGKLVSSLGRRVAETLRTRRVVTGQGRWGIWREEARWVGRWVGSQDQNLFFHKLLTAFLGSHLEWLDTLDPLQTRRSDTRAERHGDANVSSLNQCVIVSPNKMAARRFIFLLAVFLPNLIAQRPDDVLFHKPMQAMTSSQSPPSGLPILRKQSLRRTINRRQRGNRAPQSSGPLHTRAVSFNGRELEHSGVGDQPVHGHGGPHVRRASNANSIRSLVVSADGEDTRKSSTTTTSTVVPDSTIPVAHISNTVKDSLLGTSPTPRPGSSGSLASLSLQRTLSRSQSNEQSNSSISPRSFTRWGSMMSGFWSSRRESSTDDSEPMSPAREGLGISGIARMPGHTSSSSMGGLRAMVEEASATPCFQQENTPFGKSPPASLSPKTVRPDSAKEAVGKENASEARAIPPRPEIEGFPVKLAVDDGDGTINVDLPTSTSYSSSFASSFDSARQSHTAASSFNERSSISTRSPSRDRHGTSPKSHVDVAGWLKEYNQDFDLQAVRPYSELKEDIKEGMEGEIASQQRKRRTSVVSGTDDGWRDMKTVVLADASTFSIIRLRTQQRTAPKEQPSTGESSPSSTAKETLESRIVEDPVSDIDPTLINAVERVLAQSGHPSRLPSRAPSRTPSPSHLARSFETNHSHNSNHLRTTSVPKAGNLPVLEIHKNECKRVILGALEEVVRSVLAEQDMGGKGARRISGEAVPSGEVPRNNMLRDGVRRWIRETGAVAMG